jgi:nucleotidyltransferase/DNA polymerase involved in DNA repair
MRIACVVVPRFVLALEAAGHPEWRDRPVVVGGAPGERPVVVECSVQAERAGVRRGLPLREALARCHDAVVVEARPTRYADEFERMLTALEQVSPVVEGAALGCAFVDLTGLPGVGDAAGETALARDLAAATRAAVDLLPRVGVADARFAAWAAAGRDPRARSPRRGAPATAAPVQIVPPGEAAVALASLSVERMPLSDEMRRRLRWLGLRTAGDLAALPRAVLAAQFGPEGATAWDLARGEGGRPLLPRRHEPEVSDQIAFSQPVVESPAILAAARQVLARLFRRPECAGRAVRGVDLDAALANGHRWQRAITFHEPTMSRERMLRALAARVENAAFSAPVAALTLRLRGLCGEGGVQGRLFAGQGGTAHGLDVALEQLRARFGRPLIMKIVGVEPWSRLPERQYALIDYEPSTSLSR